MNKLIKELHIDEAIEMFNSTKVATTVAKELCEKYGVEYDENEGRKVRNWLNPALNLPLRQGDVDFTPKILIYDIETSLVEAALWWTGKQYVGHHQLRTEPKIITIAYKWVGDDTVTVLKWDENQSDKEMMRKFLDIYNSADMVIGQNNDKFDNRFINARAMKYNFDVNVFVKSFDIMKQTKRLFRLPSYSMDYITKYLGIQGKLGHTGRAMWEDIQFGSKKASKAALKLMSDYNVQDVLATEEMYTKLRKYMGHITHLGVLAGETKCSCPNCGSTKLKLYKTTVTATGVIRRIMKCPKDGTLTSMSNRDFLRLTLK
jgi:uncharacterized protein YprB with RNaseH-like and TPR domain